MIRTVLTSYAKDCHFEDSVGEKIVCFELILSRDTKLSIIYVIMNEKKNSLIAMLSDGDQLN